MPSTSICTLSIRTDCLLRALSGRPSEPPRTAAVENTRVAFPVFPRPVAREAHTKYDAASGATSEIQIVLLRCAFRHHSGEDRKNEPKTPDAPDALDVGPGEAARSAAGFRNFRFKEFPIADVRKLAMGGKKRPEAGTWN
jgi:hypothetical protein